MKKTFYLKEDESLQIPVFSKGKYSYMGIRGNDLSTQLKIQISNETPDYFTQLNLPISGKTVVTAPVRYLDLVAIKKTESYKQRHAFHFSPSFGWINDPNGMIYKDGEYHLFFQYNPVGTEWNNMSWGHARTKDLINWKQEKVAILPPDRKHVIFSGSGIEIDKKPYFLYTKANLNSPPSFDQYLATSTDMKRIKNEKLLIETGGETRDPRVFKYKDNLYILLFEKKNSFSLYKTDTSFRKPELCSVFSLPPLWECPDIYFLKDENDNEIIFFTGADGIIHKAVFDNEKLIVEEEGHPLFRTTLPYAGQSFNGIDKTTVISWLRTKNENKRYHGVMALPRELKFYNGKVHLLPPSNLKFKEEITKEGEKIVFDKSSDAFCLKLNLASSFSIKLSDKEFSWDSEKRIFLDGQNPFTIDNDLKGMIIYVDKEIVEIQDFEYTFIAYYEISDSYDNIIIKGNKDTKVGYSAFGGI